MYKQCFIFNRKAQSYLFLGLATFHFKKKIALKTQIPVTRVVGSIFPWPSERVCVCSSSSNCDSWATEIRRDDYVNKGKLGQFGLSFSFTKRNIEKRVKNRVIPVVQYSHSCIVILVESFL